MRGLAKREAILPADRNPALVYLASLGETGRRSIVSRLREVAGLLGHEDPGTVPWDQLRFQHVAAVIAKLRESDQAPATINLSLAALRGIAKAAFGLGLMNASDLARIGMVKPVRGERLIAGRALSAGEIGALLRTCAKDKPPTSVRDAAMIGVLYCGGLRRSEVVDLNREDYDPETGDLKVSGKGGKQRMVPFNNGAADALADWLAIRGDEPGPLFLPIDKAGRIAVRRMNSQSVFNMLRRRAKRAGVKAFSPHDLRRTFISDLLDAGADLATTQALAGHASPITTARYDRRGDDAKRRAVKLLHIPYRRVEADE